LRARRFCVVFRGFGDPESDSLLCRRRGASSRGISNLFILTNFSSFVKRRFRFKIPFLENFQNFSRNFSTNATVYKNVKKCVVALALKSRFLNEKLRMAPKLRNKAERGNSGATKR